MLFLAAVFELSCFPLWTSIYENDMRGEERRRRRRTNLKAGGGGDGGGGVGEQVVTLTEETRVGVEGGEETKGRKSSSKKKKKNAADGQGGELCGVCPYLSGVKTGKAALFIKVSHPSAPYSSAPTDWER